MARKPTSAQLDRRAQRMIARARRGEELARIAREDFRDLYPDLREAGRSITYIHELTGVSRTILHRLERERKRA